MNAKILGVGGDDVEVAFQAHYTIKYYVIEGTLPGFTRNICKQAVKQAFAIWAPHTPLVFLLRTGPRQENDIPIIFIKSDSSEIANAIIEVNASMHFFIDDNSTNVPYGPFDLIGVIAHEIGHHVFRSNTGEWPEHLSPGSNIMNYSHSERAVYRQASKLDIQFCQNKYGVSPIAFKIAGQLSQAILVSENDSDIDFSTSLTSITIASKSETSCLFQVEISDVRMKKINVVEIVARTELNDVLIKRINVWDGNNLIESHVPLVVIRKTKKKIRIGIAEKNVWNSNILRVTVEVEFPGKRTLTILSVNAQHIPSELVLHPGS